MTELVPADWIVAHRCVDLSADFGSDDLDRLIAAARPQENALASMEARFRAGFGVETDLRGDARTPRSNILISHDPPTFGGDYPTLPQVLALYRAVGGKGCLALNIKDSGLQARLKPLLEEFGVDNYFTFDGAVPDTLADAHCGIKAFGRESDIEPFNPAQPINPLANYPAVAGLWLDQFHPEFWIDRAVVERHFMRNKDVALVSPELHPWGRRDKGETLTAFWARWRETLAALRAKYPRRRMMICTKFPGLAQSFFNA